MIVVYMLLFFLQIGLLFAGRKEPIEKAGRLEKPFLRAGSYLYKKGIRFFTVKGKISEYMEVLHPREHPSFGAGLYYRKKLSMMLQICFVLTLLVILVWGKGYLENRGLMQNQIFRTEYGGEAREVSLKVSGDHFQESIKFQVSPKQYSEEELQDMFRKILPELDRILIGDNDSEEEVRTALCFPEQVEGFPFHIRWETDSYEILQSDGTVHNEQVPEEGIAVGITATLSYEEFKRQYIFYVNIMPPDLEKKEQFQQEILRQLKKADEENKDQELVLLPEEISGREITWEIVKKDESIYLFLPGILLLPFLWKAEDEKLQKKIQKREKQLISEYPEIVSKLALLLGAGLTIREAFKRIGSQRQGIAYEEMAAASIEMETGVSESQVYLHWGSRCYTGQYRKLATLLVQNLKKGSKGLLMQLENEAQNALQERRAAARKLGEEAGTKLLLPMMGMLLVVMVMIIVPAFGSF